MITSESATAAASPPARRVAAPGGDRAASRTRAMLTGAPLPTLLRLAAPNIVVMVLQALMTTVDAWYVARLGADALAGITLVYPVVMLMVTMAAGGMGGGVASAIARALGAGRQTDADALVAHALAIALAMSALFTAGVLLGGPALYAALGGSGAALDAAVAYSTIVFLGAVTYWVLNTLASILRGTGQMVVPAVVLVAGESLHLGLAPALIFGWGPLPALGVRGAALSLVFSLAVRALVLLAYLLAGRSVVHLRLRGLRPRAALFADILRVGLPASLNTVLTNLNVILITGLVGGYGTAALAGYGIGSRLEYLQIPLVFGLGSALVTLVGTNVGAGQAARAKRIAWVGAALAGAVTGAMGLGAALAPAVWAGLFSQDRSVLPVTTTYLQIAGLAYGFFGAGLALYFASQGAGRVIWPVVAGCLRLTIAVVGAWLAGSVLGWGLPGVFAAVAFSFVLFGLALAVAVQAAPWQRA